MFPLLDLGYGLIIPTYFLVVVLSLCISLIWAYYRANTYHLEKQTVLDLALVMILGGAIGGRLGYFLFETSDFNSIDIPNFFHYNTGGFVFYSGLILALLCALFYLYFYKKMNFTKLKIWSDFLTPILCFNYALGRIGCFLNGCCYGKICDYFYCVNFRWYEGVTQILRHPTQLYASFGEFLILFLLLFLQQNYRSLKSGFIFVLWLGLHGVNRLIMEWFRDDFRGDTFYGISISSLISYVILLIAITLLTLIFYQQPVCRFDSQPNDEAK